MTAVILTEGPPPALSSPVAWVQAARWAAALDLIDQLAAQPGIDQIILGTPDGPGEVPDAVATHVVTTTGAIHFGDVLASIVAEQQLTRLLYFGGGSAPLLSDEQLGELVSRLQRAEQLVLTNNRFASDWAGVVPATAITVLPDRLPRDNMLGWVLSVEAGLPLSALPAGSGSRLDIDTPLELLVLSRHPAAKPALRALLRQLDLPLAPVDKLLALLRRGGGHLFIAGRMGPEAWQAINRATDCWLRVLAEERGLVSSGRQARGEAYSLLASHLEAIGMAAFFEGLGQWADMALIDSRVLLAHHGRWPDADDRFASDLGRADAIKDPWLRALTVAAAGAPLPILLGGHSLMSGALFTLAEMV